ncbi:hypothetical protein EMPG_12095, partial [Blastomyces silverae]
SYGYIQLNTVEHVKHAVTGLILTTPVAEIVLRWKLHDGPEHYGSHFLPKVGGRRY